MKKIVTFRIYPEPARNKKYYKVFVFRNSDDMKVYAKVCGKLSPWLGKQYTSNFDYEAICTWFGRSRKYPNQIGHILVHREVAKRSTVIVHEIFHGALYYFWYNTKLKWNRVKSDKKTEERLAHIVGRMNGQYWGKWWELKLK